jgi:hypothetical protein
MTAALLRINPLQRRRTWPHSEVRRLTPVGYRSFLTPVGCRSSQFQPPATPHHPRFGLYIDTDVRLTILDIVTWFTNIIVHFCNSISPVCAHCISWMR